MVDNVYDNCLEYLFQSPKFVFQIVSIIESSKSTLLTMLKSLLLPSRYAENIKPLSIRSLLIYEAARGNLLHNVSKHRREKKKTEPVTEDKEKSNIEKEKANRLFVEEGATKYFRRLDFSPDGAFLITPGMVITFRHGSKILMNGRKRTNQTKN